MVTACGSKPVAAARALNHAPGSRADAGQARLGRGRLQRVLARLAVQRAQALAQVAQQPLRARRPRAWTARVPPVALLPRVALHLTSAQRRPQALMREQSYKELICCSEPASTYLASAATPPVRPGALHPMSAPPDCVQAIRSGRMTTNMRMLKRVLC